MPEREAEIEVYRDQAEEWRWRFRASNGKVLADSAEGYKEKGDLDHALALLRDAAAAVVIEERKKVEIAGPEVALVSESKPARPRPSTRKK